MVGLTGVISQLKPAKIIVAGDLMLDAYVFGKAKRISPEAPVPVMLVEQEDELPGGAGNVMLNLLSLGAEVKAIGRVGLDPSGNKLLANLLQDGIDIQGIVQQFDYRTPIKRRVIADSQQMIRLDYETVDVLPKRLEERIIELLPRLFDGVKALAISDYGKGFLTENLLRSLIDYARGVGIPVIVDPKGTDFAKYDNATVIKPNLIEAYSAAKKSLDAPLKEVAKTLFDITNAEHIVITRSEKGISLFSKNHHEEIFPVKSKEVKDVTGAGDTVLAIMVHAAANGVSFYDACLLSNIAAGLAIEKIGCSKVTLGELVHRLLEVDHSTKIVYKQHLFSLKLALSNQKFVLLNLSSDTGITTLMIQTIFNLSSSDHSLVIYLQEDHPDRDFIQTLSSLQQVNFIVIDSNPLDNFCSLMTPAEIYYYENNEINKENALELLCQA